MIGKKRMKNGKPENVISRLERCVLRSLRRLAGSSSRLDGKYVYPGEEPPVYYLIGSFNSWDAATMEELTFDENTGKYTITKAMDANAEFKLKDEDGNWIGAQSEGNFIVTEDQVAEGTAIYGNNFIG